jgi:hypothetical protein
VLGRKQLGDADSHRKISYVHIDNLKCLGSAWFWTGLEINLSQVTVRYQALLHLMQTALYIHVLNSEVVRPTLSDAQPDELETTSNSYEEHLSHALGRYLSYPSGTRNTALVITVMNFWFPQKQKEME